MASACWSAVSRHQCVIDTLHFRNNSPVAFSLDGVFAPGMDSSNWESRQFGWRRLVEPQLIKPHHEACIDMSGAIAEEVRD